MISSSNFEKFDPNYIIIFFMQNLFSFYIPSIWSIIKINK